MRSKILKKIFIKENAEKKDLRLLDKIIKNSDENFIDLINKKISKYLNYEENIKENKLKFIKENLDIKRKRIIDIISKVENENELENILGFIYREFIQQKIKDYMIKKLGGVGYNIDKLVSNIIINSNSNFESKINLINYLDENNGIFEGSKILTNKKGNIFSIVEYKNQCFEDIKYDLANIGGQLGFGPNQGFGEFYLAFLGRDINFSAKSDLNIIDKKVEIKTSKKGKHGSLHGGRLVGSSGYSNMASVKKQFLKILENIGIDKNDIEKYSNELNLNAKGILNLNELITKYRVSYDDVQNLFKEIFKNLFIYIDDNILEKYINKFININGTIKVVEFLKSYGQISFAYYKIIEGFDYLMLLNLDSGNYIIIETDEDIDANQDKIRFANFPTWSESRATSSSPQILIK